MHSHSSTVSFVGLNDYNLASYSFQNLPAEYTIAWQNSRLALLIYAILVFTTSSHCDINISAVCIYTHSSLIQNCSIHYIDLINYGTCGLPFIIILRFLFTPPLCCSYKCTIFTLLQITLLCIMLL